MLKTNAFTLIELLAVIIILAIISLISTPVILNVIESSREEARKRSVAGYADAVSIAIVKGKLNSNGADFNIDADWIKDNVKYSGSSVTCNEVITSSTGTILNHCVVEANSTQYCYSSGKVSNCTNKIETLSANQIEYQPSADWDVSTVQEALDYLREHR